MRGEAAKEFDLDEDYHMYMFSKSCVTKKSSIISDITFERQ